MAMQLLKRFDVPCVLGFFGRLGILPKQRDGYWYPNSGQAASVREAFAIRLFELNVPVYTSPKNQCILKALTFLLKRNTWCSPRGDVPGISVGRTAQDTGLQRVLGIG